jgi:hypothetical protein
VAQHPSLRRNRDFVLLMSGRLLSGMGSGMTNIAYPLLVLATTHSPAKAGLVAFLAALTRPLLGLPAGLAADRWNRKRLMIGADAVRALAIGALVATILAHRLAFWQIALVAFVEGVGGVLFLAAQPGAVRSVVPASQMPAAVNVLTGRSAAVQVASPPLGGALFQIGRAVPFLVDVCSYAASFLSLALMRTPFQETRERDTAPLRVRFAEGFRFLWSRPFLRATALLWGFGNFTGPGVFLVLVVVGRRQGLTGGEIGGRALRRVAARAADPPRARCPHDSPARVLVLGAHRRLPRLAERLRARRRDGAGRDRDPEHRLGRGRPPARDHARPADRASGERADDARSRGLSAGAARGRPAARARLGAHDGRRLHPLQRGPRSDGDAEPGDPGRAEPGRARAAAGQRTVSDALTVCERLPEVPVIVSV